MKILLSTAAIGLLIAGTACSDREDDAARGADISFTATDSTGKPAVTATADGQTGRVKVSTSAFDLDVKLPKLALGDESFEMSGVNLYPGSEVQSLNIDTSDFDSDEQTVAVDVAFIAPADKATVRDWFEKRFAEESIKFEASEDGFTGKTPKGEAFVLEIEAAGASSRGTFHFAG